MAIHIFDTLSESKKTLEKPRKGEKIKLFVCGPTVYDYAHIGHARTYVFFDFFVKYLRNQEIDVVYLQNITDVDDKIIARAERDKKNPLRLAEFFFKEYKSDMNSLGVDSVDTYAKATDFIPQIEKQVKKLFEKGYAYKIENDGYYFDISKFPDYGKLSKRTVEQAEDSVSRIDESVKKRNKGDFALWKFSKRKPFTLRSFAVVDGEPAWKTSLGWGRPGWHIEDTAITDSIFGSHYDIHGGGVDLKFPHHEAEIAQERAYSRKKEFVDIWMHTGALTVNGKKMSKSLGNFVTIRDFLKKHSPEALRFMILKHHYRMPMDYTDEMADEAEKNFNDISKFLERADFRIDFLKNGGFDVVPLKISAQDYSYALTLNRYLADDLDTPQTIAKLFQAFTLANKYFREFPLDELIKITDFIRKTMEILGFRLKKAEIPPEKRKLLTEYIAEYEKCRRNEQFVQADIWREKIKNLGYMVMDINPSNISTGTIATLIRRPDKTNE